MAEQGTFQISVELDSTDLDSKVSRLEKRFSEAHSDCERTTGELRPLIARHEALAKSWREELNRWVRVEPLIEQKRALRIMARLHREWLASLSSNLKWATVHLHLARYRMALRRVCSALRHPIGRRFR